MLKYCYNQKCKETLVNKILVVVIVVILLSTLFKLFKDYSVLKKKYDLLKVELKECEDLVWECEEQMGYQERVINSHLYEKDILNQEIVCLKAEINQITENPISWIRENYKSYNLEVTAYSPSVDECDSTPFIAASGESVDDYTIAVSQNMRKNGWDFGKFAYIPDHDKFYKINDVMNKRYTKRVDIFMWEKEAAKGFGFCDLDIYLLN